MTGHIVTIIGPVLDIKFSQDHLPALYNAIEVLKENGEKMLWGHTEPNNMMKIMKM